MLTRFASWIFFSIFISIRMSFAIGVIKGPPEVKQQERLVTLLEGEQIRLPCPITANPEPFYEWAKDGESVDETWPRYYIRRHFLRIKSAQIDDSGEFSCTGVNGFGKALFTFSVLVYGGNFPPGEELKPPSFVDVKPISPIIKSTGDEINLLCRSAGVPYPVITWSKNGTPLHHTGESFRLSNVLHQDSGIYSCKAKSPLGSVTHNFTIKVEEHLWDNDIKIFNIRNTTVRQGENVTIQCLVHSSISPQMQWFKLLSGGEYESLDSSLKNTTIVMAGKTYLYLTPPGSKRIMGNMTYMVQFNIRKASSLDNGRYLCVGATTKGYNFKEIFLSVVSGSDEFEGGEVASDVNWLVLIVSIVAVGVIIGIILVICQIRKTPEKKVLTAQNNLSREDPTPTTPLKVYHPSSKDGSSVPPDLIYQDPNGFLHRHHQSMPPPPDGYPEIFYYPEATFGNYDKEGELLEPHYSDPFTDPCDSLLARDGPRILYETQNSSDHNYARLTQSTSSASPLPPPYVFSSSKRQIHTRVVIPRRAHSPHTFVPPHHDPGYVVHFNL